VARVRERAEPVARVLSLRVLHGQLARITEALAGQLVWPAAPAPDWSPTEWAIAPAVAAMHGVAALLAQPLRPGPESWQQFLLEQRAHTAQRGLLMRLLLERLDADARESRVSLVPLKGAALLAQGVYEPGERPMADLDLLIESGRVVHGIRLLKRHGFRQTGRTDKHLVFEQRADKRAAALGEHYANSLKIELHTNLREPLPLRTLDLAQQVLPAAARPGLNNYASPSSLLLHVLLHASGVMSVRGLRLLHLEDIARLIRSLRSADWTCMQEEIACTGSGGLWWALPPLQLTQRYYGCVPPELLEQARAECQWWLRRAVCNGTLSSFSTSYLWITAFPALPWACGAREALRYAHRRIVPSRETLEQRRRFAQLQPRVSGGAWAQRSQLQRLWRWCVAPQPRHETLAPVRAALAAADLQCAQVPRAATLR
jgi:hypothetical protein